MSDFKNPTESQLSSVSFWRQPNGEYKGKLSFQNEKLGEMVFNMSPDITLKYLQILAKEIGQDAPSWAHPLAQSLKSKP